MSKAQTRASNKYNAKAYDRIALQVRKGQRELIRSYAESQGKSLNYFINELIQREMGDKLQQPCPSAPTEELT